MLEFISALRWLFIEGILSSARDAAQFDAHSEETVKIQLFITSAVIALGLGGAHQTFAQTLSPFVNQNPPSTEVGWNTPASLCQILPGSAQSTVDYVGGSVSFAPNASGTIGLICNMPGTMNGLIPAGHPVDYVALSFSNPNVAAGCTASVFMIDRATGAVDGWTSDKSTNFSGIWTAHAPLNKTAPLATNHTHDVDVYLFRPASAGNTCNPMARGMFTEYVNVIF